MMAISRDSDMRTLLADTPGEGYAGEGPGPADWMRRGAG